MGGGAPLDLFPHTTALGCGYIMVIIHLHNRYWHTSHEWTETIKRTTKQKNKQIGIGNTGNEHRLNDNSAGQVCGGEAWRRGSCQAPRTHLGGWGTSGAPRSREGKAGSGCCGGHTHYPTHSLQIHWLTSQLITQWISPAGLFGRNLSALFTSTVVLILWRYKNVQRCKEMSHAIKLGYVLWPILNGHSSIPE